MLKSIAFPEMVSNLHTNIVSDENNGKEATLQNLKLVLYSVKRQLLGDPYFGTNLLKLVFDQNSTVIRDLVIDEIYTAIKTFIPQLQLQRKNITINSNRTTITITIEAQNRLDYTVDTYNLKLLDITEI